MVSKVCQNWDDILMSGNCNVVMMKLFRQNKNSTLDAMISNLVWVECQNLHPKVVLTCLGMYIMWLNRCVTLGG